MAATLECPSPGANPLDVLDEFDSFEAAGATLPPSFSQSSIAVRLARFRPASLARKRSTRKAANVALASPIRSSDGMWHPYLIMIGILLLKRARRLRTPCAPAGAHGVTKR
jgi:hypothetical protein